jgi:hypothetical protein
VYTCNPRTQEDEAGGSQVARQPELHNEILSKRERERERQKERKKERKRGKEKGKGKV